MTTIQHLRREAISRSLFRVNNLQAALDRLGFVQADPIRAPARAQDLILRQRVEGYRAGDLERDYPSLDIDEDILYAYGFMPRSVRSLIHPRRVMRVSSLHAKVLTEVQRLGETHPAALEGALGARRVINAWGGYSKATTSALEDLHYHGRLRVVRRERGIRLYAAATSEESELSRDERLRGLIRTIAATLSPIPERTLRANIARYKYLGDPRRTLMRMLAVGELERGIIEGVPYLWTPASENSAISEGDRVRFLAPFDPVVWDRLRFEHFWGWAYRFEAYTPVKKRIRGYYAMPMLWRDRVIGWANATQFENRLEVEVGYVDKAPRERAFRLELDAEIARLEYCCQVE